MGNRMDPRMVAAALGIVEACERNYIDHWRASTRASTREWCEDGGITRCITGLPQEIFNVVLCCSLDPSSAEAQIDKVIGEFKARRIPLIWHVGRTTSPADLGDRLALRGYPKDYELVAMAAQVRGIGQSAAPKAGVTVRRCETVDDHQMWISCLTSSWDSPEPVRRWMLANPYFSRPTKERIMYLGFVDGQPCGAVMLLERNGVAGLQCVGTIKQAQRKGVGETLVRAALADSAVDGFESVVVLSTTEGVPLYSKVGFKPYGTLPEHGMYFDRSTL